MIAAADNLPLALLGPELALVVGFVAVLAIDLWPGAVRHRVGPWLGVAACVVGFCLAVGADRGQVATMLALDAPASLARLLLHPVAAVVLLAGIGGRRSLDQPGAWSAAILALALGASLAAAAANLVSLWLGLELVATASYTLVAFGGQRRAAEAGMKFVLFGGASSSLMLFGISHVYGATGHLDFAGIGAVLAGGVPATTGLALLLAGVGIAYKLTLVPFHFYAPDVYQGAPPLGVAAVAVLPKIGAATALVRFLQIGLPPAAASAPALAASLAWLAVASALFAAFTAVVQRDAKRILAFSGIGHGGAILLAVACAPGRDAVAAAGFYLLTYAGANVGAFVCLSVLEREQGSSSLTALAGAFRQRPWVASALCAFVFSLAGIPPLAGFLGKWAVLQQAVARGMASDGSPVLAWAVPLFLLATAVSAWSYLLVVRAVVLAPAPDGEPRPRQPLPMATRCVLGICMLATLAGGVWLGGLAAIRDSL